MILHDPSFIQKRYEEIPKKNTILSWDKKKNFNKNKYMKNPQNINQEIIGEFQNNFLGNKFFYYIIIKLKEYTYISN